MQTLKTAVVVVLLLVVLYGAYDIITRPAPEPPPEVMAAIGETDDLAPPDIGFEEPVVVSPEQGGSAESPAPQLGTSTSAAGLAQSDRPNAAPSTNPGPGVPVAAEPPVSQFVPPSQPPTPADPRLQQNPFINDPPAATAGTGSGEVEPDESGSDELNKPNTEVPSDGTVGAQLNTSTPYPTTNTTPRAGERAFVRVQAAAKQDVAEGRYRDALAKLSIFYHSPDLSSAEHQALLDWLDPLAARVIYSRESLLEPAYTVRRNDTLQQIAAEYQIPWQLLQKINGIEDPEVLVPGTSLKVIRGPFRAEIRLAERELTLFLNDLYAGRFPIVVGNDPAPQPGEYQVRDKQTARAYYGADGRTIAADSPLNPYGNVWIDLGNDLAIHSTPSQPNAVSQGCIALSPGDASDVFSILSVGSHVKIRP